MSKIKIKPSLKRKNSEWEIIPDDIPMAQDGRITLDEFRPKFTNSNQDITNNLKLKAQINSKGTQANPVNLPEVEISTVRDKPLGFAGQSLKSQQTNPYNVPASQVASQIFNFVPEAMHTPSRLVNYGIGAYKNKDLTFNPYQSEITETLGLETDPNSLLHSIRNFAVDNAADFLVPVEGLVGFRNKSFTNPFKKSFKSEIDWGKWNKEIPGNKALMQEYHTIEQQAKANDTWMKNPDGSAFQGTPEQFVQQNSENFKKAFGSSKLVNPDGSPTIQYHGSAKKFDAFDESKFQLGDAGYSGQGIYTTPSKTTAKSYATSSAKFHSGDIEPTVYELYGQANNPISSSQLIKEGKGRDLFNFHRKRNWKGELTPEESLIEYDAAISDQLPNVQNIRPWHDAREIVFPRNTQLKSAIGNNGMFDMTNPNIYKSILPIGLGLGAASQIDQKKQGGNIKTDSQGYWNPKNHGKPVRIPSNKITMKGVNQPLYGIDDTGFAQMMYPNQDYQFPGSSVVELPLAQDGGELFKLHQSKENEKYKIYPEKQWVENWIRDPEFEKRLTKNLEDINSKKSFGVKEIPYSFPFTYGEKYWKEKAKLQKENALKRLTTVKDFYAEGYNNNEKLIDNFYNAVYPNDPKTAAYQSLSTQVLEGGSYLPAKHALIINSQLGDKSTAVHEYTHSTNLDDVLRPMIPQGKFVDDEYNKLRKQYPGFDVGYDIFGQPIMSNYDTKGVFEKTKYINSDSLSKKMNIDPSTIQYLNKSREVYPRIMELRYENQIKPGQVIDKEFFKKIKEKSKENFIFKIYSDEQIIDLMNKLAQEKEELPLNKAKNGGSIPKMQQGGNVRPPIKGTKEQYQAYQDSLDLYKQSLQVEPNYFKVPKIDEAEYNRLIKKSVTIPEWNFDEEGYKKDKKAGKSINFKDYMYDVHSGSVKDSVAFENNIGRHYQDANVSDTLKDGRIKTYQYMVDGKVEKGDYNIYDPKTGTTRTIMDKELMRISSDKIKPIRTDYYGKDTLIPASKTTLSSTGWHDAKAEAAFKKTDEFQNYYIPFSSNDVYQKPVQPIIYQPEVNNSSDYNRQHPPIYLTNSRDPRLNQYTESGNQYLYKRPKEQPINIQSVKPDLLPLPDINMFNPIPFEKGTYFSRKRQSQEQSAKGKKDYFDKKTGKLLGTYKNGGKVKNSDWEIIN